MGVVSALGSYLTFLVLKSLVDTDEFHVGFIDQPVIISRKDDSWFLFSCEELAWVF